CSMALEIFFSPLRIALQRFARRVAIPAVAIAAFFRNLIYIVVDGFIAIAENRAVAADIIITRPDRAAFGRIDQQASRLSHGLVSDALNSRLLKPGGGGIN